MKITILLLSLITSSLYAAPNLVMESSSSKGKEQKALVFEKTDLLIVKNSNKYDSKPDYRLGKLRLKKSDELYQTEERLKQISMALVAAEKILNKKACLTPLCTTKFLDSSWEGLGIYLLLEPG